MRASAARRTILPVSVRGSSSQTTMRSGVFEPRRLDRTCWRSCSGSAVAIAKHDGGLDALPPFLVRNADDDRVGDVGVAQEHVLDLGRRNGFPTANDGVVGPSGDEEKPHAERAPVVGHQLRELLITETVIQWHQRYAGASGGKQGWGEGRAVHPQNRSLRVLVALAEQGAA